VPTESAHAPAAGADGTAFPAVITVKTTRQNHGSRVLFSLQTWLAASPRARGHTFFVSDGAPVAIGEYVIK
jgi:hypothetical protein